MIRKHILPILGIVVALFLSDLVYNCVAIRIPLRLTNIVELASILLISFPVFVVGFFLVSVLSRSLILLAFRRNRDSLAFALTILIVAAIGFLAEFVVSRHVDGTLFALKAGAKSAIIAAAISFLPALIANFAKPTLEISRSNRTAFE